MYVLLTMCTLHCCARTFLIVLTRVAHSLHGMRGLTGRLALLLADGLRQNSVLQSLDIGDNGLNKADKTMFLTLLRKSKVSALKMYVNAAYK